MLAFLKLPVAITFWCMVAMVIVVAICKPRPQPIGFALVIAVAGFIPSCVGIMHVVDQFRYGRFEYASAAVVPKDGYIELPSAALNIVLYRDAVGHCARFQVETDELREWFESMRLKRPDLNRGNESETWEPKPESRLTQLSEAETFELDFKATGWPYDLK
ncbi:MAG: hypothetical protein ABL921_13505, partial [Pirellula sp.]